MIWLPQSVCPFELTGIIAGDTICHTHASS
jgi:hypothetical protein